MKREAFNKANFVTQFYTKSVQLRGQWVVAQENITCLDWFCRNFLGLKEVCCGADWEHCTSCNGDITENVVAHSGGDIFLGCFCVSLSGSVNAVGLLKC